jgi:hypothetical protein
MTLTDYLVFTIVGLIISGVAVLTLIRHLSPAARERRKRRRNYSRVIAKTKRPMVTLSAQVDNDSK